MSDPPFDFVRYFTRVHQGQTWHAMQVGMATFAGVGPGQRVLDVGTGPGRLVDHLRGNGVAVVGADGDPKMGARFRTHYATHPYVVTAADALALAAHSFDATLAGNILFFLPEPLRALSEMARVTRPGGVIAAWNPSERMSVVRMQSWVDGRPELDDFERQHLPNWAGVAESNRRWSAADLRDLFNGVGLVEFETAVTLDGLARYARGRVPGECAGDGR